MDGVPQTVKQSVNPLRMWNKLVKSTTNLGSAKDIKPAYMSLCGVVDENVLNGKLADHPDLFPKHD